jgi:hypothetical protein
MPPKKEADMELYAAIDLHSSNSVLVVTDAEDHMIFAKRLRNDLELIGTALRSCPGDIRAAPADAGLKYGLGVYTDTVGQHPRIRYNGGWSAYLSSNRVYPADHAAISVFYQCRLFQQRGCNRRRH